MRCAAHDARLAGMAVDTSYQTRVAQFNAVGSADPGDVRTWSRIGRLAGYIGGGTLPGQTTAGGIDAFVRKYDPNGTEMWTRQFGTAGDDFALGQLSTRM